MPDPAKPPGDFEGLYRATLAPLRSYLARMLGNRSDAQDVAHDAYTRVYRAMDDTEVKKPEALLFTTARNLAINQIKRRGIVPMQSADSNIIALTPEQAPGVEQIVMARQEWAATEAAISRLPPGCRAVLMLCTLRGCTHPVAAARLGISPKTVEKQHARALRLLRASLQSDDDSRAAAAAHCASAGT